MPYADKKRNAACKRMWQMANRAQLSRDELAAYHRNPAPFKARVKRYKEKLGPVELRIRKRRNRGMPEPTRPEPTHCEVCGAPAIIFARGLHLDHCHLMDKFRGWLCPRCNRAIGEAKDNPVTLRALATYVENSYKK
jgi:hypothetical protein